VERVLVIAYGNRLRCDDGVAWQAAENLRKRLPDSVEVQCTHQLTPELAEDASRASLVIFLDVSRDGEPGKINTEEVFPRQGTRNYSHHYSPPDVIALSDELYGAKPRAFIVSVNGECFDHGQKLSPAIMRSLPLLETTTEELIRQYACVVHR
jgi:hydrogenase maturation protease